MSLSRIYETDITKLHEIGRGSFSKCWLAHLNGNEEEKFVLKELHVCDVAPLSENWVKKRIAKEVETMRELSQHESFVRILSSYGPSGTDLITGYTMEYCPYGSMRLLIQRLQMEERPRLCLKSLWMLQVSDGFKYLQEGPNEDKVIVHRDLAADNVLIDCLLNAKIADFGLEKNLPQSVMTADTWEFEKRRGFERVLPELYADICQQPDKYGDRYLYGILVVEVFGEFSVRECFKYDGAKDDYKRMVLEGRHLDSFQRRIIGCSPEPSQERDKAIEIMRMTAQVHPENRSKFTQVSQVWNQCDVRAMHEERRQTLDYFQKTDDTEQQLTQMKLSNSDPLSVPNTDTFVDVVFRHISLSKPQYRCLCLDRWNAVRLIGREDFSRRVDECTKPGVKCAAKLLSPQLQLVDKLSSVSNEIDKVFLREKTIKLQIEAKLRSALVAKDSDELLSLYASLDSNVEFQVYSLNASLAHHVASHHVDLLCLRKLVDKLGVTCLACRNSTGETPVHLAARYKGETWMELCRNFLGSECFLVQANSGGTVVHYAATNESSSSSLRWIAKELGKEYFVATDRLGNSAIHYSARYQSLNTLKFLLAKFGWEIFELKNCEDETVIDWIEKDTNTNRRESKQAWIAGRQQPQGAQSLAAQLSAVVITECPFRERWHPARLIGRGGFGEVHEVLTDRGVTCAAKTLRLPLQLGAEQSLVSNEIEKVVSREKNLCQLQHDNIVKFLYITKTEPATVVVFMELLDGKTLEAFIDKKALDEDKIRDFSKQICNALSYMHSRDPSVIHRDLNCANIIVLTNTMLIKLIDFGLSVTLEQSVSHISASSASPKGTLSFMAPELVAPNDSDTPKYSRESDIWAFGCSVFQMATGGRPFAEYKNSWTLPERLRSSGAPALPEGCSAELKDFYRRCTANKCKKRLPAQELMKHEFLTNQRLQSSKRKFGGLFGDRK